MTKRRRFIIESVLLSLGLLGTQFVDANYRYLAIFILGIATYFMTAFFLREDLKKIGWLMNLTLPSLYTCSVALFYFLLPEVILSRILILVFFGIGMYALLLVENIFTVAAVRTIQLLRAAQAVSFLLSLITAFLFYDAIFSYRLPAFINSGLILIISWIIILPALWSVKLSEIIDRKILTYSFTMSCLLGQLALIISFWPLTIAAVSLFLVAGFYIYLGIIQSFLDERLFRNTLEEYLRVGFVILIIIIILGQWG